MEGSKSFFHSGTSVSVQSSCQPNIRASRASPSSSLRKHLIPIVPSTSPSIATPSLFPLATHPSSPSSHLVNLHTRPSAQSTQLSSYPDNIFTPSHESTRLQQSSLFRSLTEGSNVSARLKTCLAPVRHPQTPHLGFSVLDDAFALPQPHRSPSPVPPRSSTFPSFGLPALATIKLQQLQSPIQSTLQSSSPSQFSSPNLFPSQFPNQFPNPLPSQTSNSCFNLSGSPSPSPTASTSSSPVSSPRLKPSEPQVVSIARHLVLSLLSEEEGVSFADNAEELPEVPVSRSSKRSAECLDDEFIHPKRQCLEPTLSQSSFDDTVSCVSIDSYAVETYLIEYDSQPLSLQDKTLSGHALVRHAKDVIHRLFQCSQSQFQLRLSSSSQTHPLLQQIDEVEKQLTPEQRTSLVTSFTALRATSTYGSPDSLRKKVLFHLLAELKCVVEFIQKSSQKSQSSAQQPSEDGNNRADTEHVCALHRLLISTLFVLVCRVDTTRQLLDQPEFRSHRHWIMSDFFATLFNATAGERCPDVVMISKLGLTQMDVRHRKIPREVVESSLRPALVKFCDVSKLNLPLIAGLHSVVELFPLLFKEEFAKKIIELLRFFTDRDTVRSKLKDMPDAEVIEIPIRMLDLFRVFATTKAFSCAQFIPQLCELVIQLESAWPPHTTPSGESDLLCLPFQGCVGPKAPLCRLLCIYPVQAVDYFLSKSNDAAVGSLFSSFTSCRHGWPLSRELEARIGMLSHIPNLSRQNLASMQDNASLMDVTLLVGEEGYAIGAHRVVLASRCPYFRHLLTNGMSESFKHSIPLPHLTPEPVQTTLNYIYQGAKALDSLSYSELKDVLVVADFLQLDALVSAVEDKLCAAVNPKNALELAKLAMSWPGTDASVQMKLDAAHCGSNGGEALLRACQAQVLTHLGSLATNLDLADSLTTHLLVSNCADPCCKHNQ